MFVVDLYNGIYKLLANDTEILELMNLDPNTVDNLSKAKQIQKRSKPQRLVESLPIITFYNMGGDTDPNNFLVYGSVFVFDVYTNNDIDKAHKIANRIFKLFDGEIPKFENIENFDVEFQDAHESDCDMNDVYCFTMVLTFFVSTDK